MVVAGVGGQQGVVDQICALSVRSYRIPDELRRPYAVDSCILCVGVINTGDRVGIGEYLFAEPEVEYTAFPMDHVGGAKQVHTVIVPFPGSGIAHVGGRHEVFVGTLSAVDVGVACSVFDSCKRVCVEYFSPAEKLVEAHAFFFFCAQCIIGYLFSRFHVAVEVTVAVVGRRYSHGKIDV